MNTNYIISKGVCYIMNISSWKTILKEYIKNNFKEYLLVCILFIIGIFIGVMTINFSNEKNIEEIEKVINEVVNNYKKVENINNLQLTFQSIKRNVLFAIILLTGGTTIIGLPIVLLSILIRGVILGFTISSITVALGTLKGILFCIVSLVLQNILYIPAILTIGVSSIKLYKSIITDKRKENIKIEIIRHTIISTIMIAVLVLSTIIENFISLKIIKKIIKYF